MIKYYQGYFKPKNPHKYKGNPTQICYRSGWELKLFTRLDVASDVIWWSSEELAIPYRCPVRGNMHRYYPDVIYKTVNETVMIEVKPKAQTAPPVLTEGKKITRGYKKAVITYAVNDAKWKAARAYCREKGWKFVIMSEKDIGV